MLAAELLKVRKRWMPYVLLLVMAMGAAVQIWLVGYVNWRGESEVEFEQSALRAFALPWSLSALLDSGQFWGAILVGILVASTVATEHGWGTVRQALIRGQTRNQYLAMKLLGSTLIAAVSLLLAFGIGVSLSVIATAVADRSVTLDVPGGPSALDIALMILRAGYAVLPYGLLAFCLAVVGRSTTLGVAGILLFMFAEAILLAVLESIGGVAADARAFLMGHNASALLAANRIGFGDYNTFAPRSVPLTSDLPDPAVAALVLALYSLAFLTIAFVTFRRRDIQG
jgi:ABC-type transport system involved in multi-copper enzyme maturation permease subunit